MLFENRADAGQQLAAKLTEYANRDDVLVLALPRGGVPVAFEVAQALRAPMDVYLVRKLGVPGHPELAFGAIAADGVRVLNDAIIRSARVSDAEIEAVSQAELRELKRREQLYRAAPPSTIKDRTIIVVDDGLATGASMRAAVLALRAEQPAKLVVAVPTASEEMSDDFRDEVDDLVCAITPDPFYAVGLWYRDFSQVSDDEVRDLMARASQPPASNQRV